MDTPHSHSYTSALCWPLNCLTCTGLKVDVLAADAKVLMGIHPQLVLGPLNQTCKLYGGLVFDWHTFHSPVTLEDTREAPIMGRSGLLKGHKGGACAR